MRWQLGGVCLTLGRQMHSAWPLATILPPTPPRTATAGRPGQPFCHLRACAAAACCLPRRHLPRAEESSWRTASPRPARAFQCELQSGGADRCEVANGAAWLAWHGCARAASQAAACSQDCAPRDSGLRGAFQLHCMRAAIHAPRAGGAGSVSGPLHGLRAPRALLTAHLDALAREESVSTCPPSKILRCSAASTGAGQRAETA